AFPWTLVSRMCIPTSVWPLRPALDVWRQFTGMSLNHACSRPNPVRCFPVYS
ncbi:2877_t:CDS:1, partial [Acaulospora morrowiae]